MDNQNTIDEQSLTPAASVARSQPLHSAAIGPITLTITPLGTKLIDQENEISLRRVEGIDLLKLSPCCLEFLTVITPLEAASAYAPAGATALRLPSNPVPANVISDFPLNTCQYRLLNRPLT